MRRRRPGARRRLTNRTSRCPSRPSSSRWRGARRSSDRSHSADPVGAAASSCDGSTRDPFGASTCGARLCRPAAKSSAAPTPITTGTASAPACNDGGSRAPASARRRRSAARRRAPSRIARSSGRFSSASVSDSALGRREPPCPRSSGRARARKAAAPRARRHLPHRRTGRAASLRGRAAGERLEEIRAGDALVKSRSAQPRHPDDRHAICSDHVGGPKTARELRIAGPRGTDARR